MKARENMIKRAKQEVSRSNGFKKSYGLMFDPKERKGQAQACKKFRRPGSGLSKPGLAWPIPNPKNSHHAERSLDHVLGRRRKGAGTDYEKEILEKKAHEPLLKN
ncbi:hypothetical protein MTR_5g096210 [Medicago truncatula]|uniref:Uncharacterized protein n=1 Tax=Medicago truncatula TaxID=3880 RepID=G7KEJ0_MEDTR|nr:hypothetical protein MTR_5g096210 [Medicago truncatula]